MTAEERAAAVREALMLVASNVAKHTICRDGWTEDDACFQVDLRDAEAKVMAAVREAVDDALERAAHEVEIGVHYARTAEIVAKAIRALKGT